MLQTYMIGTVFFVGIIVGLILSFVSTNFNVQVGGVATMRQTWGNSRSLLLDKLIANKTAPPPGSMGQRVGGRSPLNHQEVHMLDRESDIQKPLNFSADGHFHQGELDSIE